MYLTPNAGTSAASQAFWQVENIEQEVAELEAKGISFEDYGMPNTVGSITTAGGAKAAWFKVRRHFELIGLNTSRFSRLGR